MDLLRLRAPMTTNKYHLNSESTMMEAAAQQRQVRLNRRSITEGEAQTTKREAGISFVHLVHDSMVKVAVSSVSDEEVRALFECMVGSCVANGDEYAKAMTQWPNSRSMCKAKIPEKLFGGEDNILTLTYTKTTKMIQTQGGATLLDKAESTLKEVMSVYGSVLRGGEVTPLPSGCQKWGAAIRESLDSGAVSNYLESLRAEGSTGADWLRLAAKPRR